MTLVYLEEEIYVWGFSYKLGGVRRGLEELKSAGLICNEVSELAAQGYRANYSIGPRENLLGLGAEPFERLLEKSPTPTALVFHHSYGESASLPTKPSEGGFMSHVRYFPAALMREFKLDHVPYLMSFGSGCTGLLSLLMIASGLCQKRTTQPVLCLTADVKPPMTTYDALREKILTSDCSSGFFVGREKRGYRLLGITYYSSTREIVPLVQIVQRAVKMIRQVIKETAVDSSSGEMCIHYPNIFAGGWDMVSQYLQVPRERHVLEGMAERAHCLSSDSMISLAKFHGRAVGRIHVVLNFGSGLHLGACILKEEAA